MILSRHACSGSILRALSTGAAGLGILHLVVALPSLLVKVLRRTDSTLFPGVERFRMVTPRLWRGAAPARIGYRELAASGVVRVVDLRAEVEMAGVREAVHDLGLEVVHVPIRDGQIPSADQIMRVMDVVERDDGVVFAHCGAGVGRTGSVVAALRIKAGSGAVTEWVEALSHGPLTLEQQVFILRQSWGPTPAVVPSLVVALSRLIDSPRRLSARLRDCMSRCETSDAAPLYRCG